LGYSADHAGLEVEERRAGFILAARGLVVEYIDTVKLRVGASAVLAVAADAVLVAQHILKIGAHLASALARLHVRNLVRKNSLEAGARGRKRTGKSGET
jgi:hypothetical protein